MTLSNRKNKAKPNRPSNVDMSKGSDKALLHNYYGEEELSPNNFDDIFEKYKRFPTTKQRALNHYVSMKLRELERKKELTTEDKTYRAFLFDILEKITKFYNMPVNKEAERSYVEEPTSTAPFTITDRKGKEKVLLRHRYTPLTKDEKAEQRRLYYRDEYIFKNYLQYLYVGDEELLKTLLRERGLLQYYKIKNSTIDVDVEEYKRAQKKHRKQRLMSFKRLLQLKEDYIDDNHTEKEWNDLWK